ncbi:MFS transporter [Alloiococcus sp. CFN-8]|uniref:MFS transporter n=1 Tax=Alloiococcus sp. CFN-8 TaxID=3416081 RepID=UPI003CF82897
MKSQLTVKYSLVQGSYWAAFCSVIGYASPFLLSRDFTASNIGVLMAWGNVLSVILQPLVASMADRSRRVRLNALSAIIASIGLFSAALLYIIPNSFYITAGLFAVILTITSMMMPMVNSLSVKLTNRGYNVNYGIARGVGSLAYAGVSYLLGYLIKFYGENIIIVVVLILYMILVLILLWFKAPKEELLRENSSTEQDAAPLEKDSLLTFIKRYKRFFFMNIGIICLFTFHNIINTYLLQIMVNVGGDSRDMGVSIAIAALLELPTMFLFSIIVKRVEANKLLKIAAIFFTIKAIAFYLSSSVLGIHISQLFQSVSFALYIPASVHYTNILMSNSDKIKGQAMISAAMTAAGVTGNLLGGYLLDASGAEAMLLVGLIFSIVGMVIFLLSTPLPESRTHRNQDNSAIV